jgi:hypothetical protein
MVELSWIAFGGRAEQWAPAFGGLIAMPWSGGEQAWVPGVNECKEFRRGWQHR